VSILERRHRSDLQSGFVELGFLFPRMGFGEPWKCRFQRGYTGILEWLNRRTLPGPLIKAATVERRYQQIGHRDR